MGYMRCTNTQPLEDHFHLRSTINEPECKETLQECAAHAELLTAPQDLHEVQIRNLESQCSSSYKSLYRLGHAILKTLWEHMYNALDDLHLEYTFDYLYNPENNDYTLDVFVSSDAGNDHLGFAWHLLRSSQEIYAVSTQIREQFDTTLLEGNHKPPCTEAIFWDPNLGEYHLLHNEL
jgi:hypothetical protein